MSIDNLPKEEVLSNMTVYLSKQNCALFVVALLGTAPLSLWQKYDWTKVLSSASKIIMSVPYNIGGNRVSHTKRHGEVHIWMKSLLVKEWGANLTDGSIGGILVRIGAKGNLKDLSLR